LVKGKRRFLKKGLFARCHIKGTKVRHSIKMILKEMFEVRGKNIKEKKTVLSSIEIEQNNIENLLIDRKLILFGIDHNIPHKT
jgi:hypothetical protein